VIRKRKPGHEPINHGSDETCPNYGGEDKIDGIVVMAEALAMAPVARNLFKNSTVILTADRSPTVP
jgi:hypothetical protein